MDFMIEWGLDRATGQCHEQPVSSVEELEAALRGIAAERGRGDAPYVVTVYPVDADHEGLQVGVGHPDRGFVLFVSEGGGYGVEPGVDGWPEAIGWDYNGQLTDYKPAWTRVRPEAVRQAALQYIRTGQRPGNLRWLA